jgi:hypothetical protein
VITEPTDSGYRQHLKTSPTDSGYRQHLHLHFNTDSDVIYNTDSNVISYRLGANLIKCMYVYVYDLQRGDFLSGIFLLATTLALNVLYLTPQAVLE